jgi:AAA+ ATPase superfamily predicted ATPase
MKNPFKFGSIVEEPYFTNRHEEIKKIQSILASENHLIVMSPRRYGKTSLVYKALKASNRPFISLDLQVVTTEADFAAQLLNRIYRVYPFEKVKQRLKKFRIFPTITLNPITNETNVSFSPGVPAMVPLEDVRSILG